MPTPWKSLYEDLAEAVRAEREARRTGEGLKDAADRVTALLDPPGDEPDPEIDPA